MARVREMIPLRARVQSRRLLTRAMWGFGGYDAPAPHHVKLHELERFGHLSGTWVETGTYLGDTTAFLARHSPAVYTIEPSAVLAERARKRFRRSPNVQVLEGLSEDVFPPLLESLSGTVSFWLDGHASGGPTHRGPLVTPIRQELAAIGDRLPHLEQVAVLVDDFRGFGPSAEKDGDYPSRSSLVNWADDLGLNWVVAHDIFAAWS